MASFRLASIAELFAVGATVPAYLSSQLTDPTAPVSGTAVTTAIVASDGSLTFAGLADDTAYVAYDGVRSKRFRTPVTTVSSDSSYIVIVHSADANVARPDEAVSATWIGSVRPNHMAAADVWVDTATAAGTVTGLWKPADSSLIGATFDPIFGGNQLALAVGRVSTGRVPLADTNTISTLEAYVFAAGVTLTGCVAGVWSLAGVLLGQTADQSTAWTAAGLKSMPLTAPVTVTGDVIVGLFLATAATAPIFQFSNNSIPAILNRGLASPAYRGARVEGQSSLPASLPALTTESRAPWIGVS